jgi:hypothetical protein
LPSPSLKHILARILGGDVAQVTLYLDDETAQRAKAAAQAAGLSQSRWLAQLVRERTAGQWPSAVRETAGSWPDFPEAEDLRDDAGQDVDREPL